VHQCRGGKPAEMAVDVLGDAQDVEGHRKPPR
jgi:hypothetical protein